MGKDGEMMIGILGSTYRSDQLKLFVEWDNNKKLITLEDIAPVYGDARQFGFEDKLFGDNVFRKT